MKPRAGTMRPREATRIAVDTVRTALAGEPDIDRVVFCCFSERDREIYQRALAEGSAQRS
ncbi:MAG TPA: hypothetical protein VNM90_13415 [Haliangium sp.]|nr:hypothetical protein [Haliangium sp.]